MSLRPLRLAAGLLLTSLAFGAAPVAPALADGMIAPPPRYHAPRYVRHHVRYVPRVRTVYRTVPRVVYVPQPVPVLVQYASPCGGCGCGVSGYVGGGYADYEPQYAPAYYGGYSGYYGGGYVGARFGRVGFGRGFYGGRVGIGRGFYGRRAGFRY